MDHFHAEETAAGIAARANSHPNGQLLDLATVEIQKAQRQHIAFIVAKFDDQLAARPVSNFVVAHHPFHLSGGAGQQGADRRQRGLVFVTHR